MTRPKTLFGWGIFLALALLSAPAQAATANDTFAGSGALTTGWSNIRAGLSQSGGKLLSTASLCLGKRTDITPGAAQYSQGVWGISASLIFNGQQHLLVRFQDIDNYYQANFDDGRHSVTIIRRIAGSQSTIYTVAVPANFVAGDSIKVDITSAHVLTLYRNGSSFGTFDDAAGVGALTSGSVGIGMSGATTDQGAWDYWEGGDVGSGCTAPTVTVDPSNASVSEPATANFTVTATGTGLSYQWQRATTNVSTGSGGTTNSYTTAATTVAGDNGATFRAIVTGTCGADTSAAATLTVTAPTGGNPLPHSDDFESIDSTCWASRPNGDENNAGCGPYNNIGLGTSGQDFLRAGRFGVAHSGTRSVQIKYTVDEQATRFRLDSLDNNHIFVRQWMRFVSPYDHAFGEKILRLDALDTGGGIYYEPICFVRSATQTSGSDAMASITCEPNGGSGNFGTANITFPNNTWFELQFEFQINTPGGSDGICRMWYNDSLISSQTSLSNMRTSNRGGGYNHLTDNHNITLLSFGGWYSDGGRNPAAAAIKYMDDVCAQTTKCASLVSGIPPSITSHPSSVSKIVGQTATFTVAASGSATLSYQWKKGGVNVSGGSGGTTTSYTTPTLVLGDNGNSYTCAVTNSDGSATSNAAILTVTTAAAAARKLSILRKVGIGR